MAFGRTHVGHGAHTTWFFETFVLRPHVSNYRPFDEAFEALFNSYYETIGSPYPRSERGLLSRPAVADVYSYRSHVDAAMLDLIQEGLNPDLNARIRLGIEHEQQHQELLLTDIKHILGSNPLRPTYSAAYRNDSPVKEVIAPTQGWLSCPEGVRQIGQSRIESGNDDFHFDNEGPRHRIYLHEFALASRLVTNGEFREFIEDDGYSRHELWLADGWTEAKQRQWQSPLYWQRTGERWLQYTLDGVRALQDAEPVCHISYYEADAYARWRQCRLPTEAEWEIAASNYEVDGNLVESGALHPLPAKTASTTQFFGDVWEWTASDYAPYPGYRPAAGALGEYNGKFMCNQRVLRGGSCATPRAHLRATYRNFFPPSVRWQFSGLRLARSV